MNHECVLPFKNAVDLYHYCFYIFIKRVELTLSVFIIHRKTTKLKEYRKVSRRWTEA